MIKSKFTNHDKNTKYENRFRETYYLVFKHTMKSREKCIFILFPFFVVCLVLCKYIIETKIRSSQNMFNFPIMFIKRNVQ